MDSLIQIKDRIKALRKKRNLSQTELGKLTGLSLKTVSTIETGRSDLSTEQLKVLSQFFEVSADYLLTGKEGTSEISPDERAVLELYRKDAQIRDALKNTIEFKKKTLGCLENYTHSEKN